MADFPGFPTNNFDHQFETVGPALAGLIVRDRAGIPRAGILSSRADLLRTRADWTLDAAPFVAVRAIDRAILLGGTTDASLPEILPAPSANARLDVIYSLPADVGAGEEIVGLGVVSGVPAAVPSKPAIPAGAIEVGTLRVPAGATATSGCVLTNTFPHTATAGGVIRFRTIAERDQFDAVPSQMCLVDSIPWVRTDTGWTRLVPAEREKWVGQVGARTVPANSHVLVDVLFPQNTFTGTPVVVPGVRGVTGKFSCSVAGISKDGFQIRLNNGEAVSRNIGAEVTAER